MFSQITNSVRLFPFEGLFLLRCHYWSIPPGEPSLLDGPSFVGYREILGSQDTSLCLIIVYLSSSDFIASSDLVDVCLTE